MCGTFYISGIKMRSCLQKTSEVVQFNSKLNVWICLILI